MAAKPSKDPQIALAEIGEALADQSPAPDPEQLDAPRPAPLPFIERLQPWVEIFSKIATVAVLALAFLQYYNAGLDQKRERALRLVDQWIDSGYPDRLANINDYFASSFRAARREISSLPDEKTRQRALANARDNTFLFLVEPSSPVTEQTRKDIDLLLRFFAQADICVSARLCDAEVAGAYFLVEARSTRQGLDPLFKIMREGAFPTYGKALDDFIRQVTPESAP